MSQLSLCRRTLGIGGSNLSLERPQETLRDTATGPIGNAASGR
jgi:hypothetical protein